MSMKNTDGLRFFSGSPDENIAVESERLDQYVNYINKNNIKYVTVSLFWGYKQKDISFISKCPTIECLGLSSPLINDYSPIYNLKQLKWLRVDDPQNIVDLAQLPALEELHIDHHKHIQNLGRCSSLKTLDTSFYNPPEKNMVELSNLLNLTSLRIYRSNVDSLKGLGNLNHLEHIFLYSFPNLHCIDELNKISDSLTVLVVEGCKKIENFEFVACLSKLKVLKFVNCGNISNISFIKQMSNLRAFVFVDSNIVDGNLSPCVGLEYAGFLNKKHYSIKRENLPFGESSQEIHALLQLH
jgi:protein phosphatase 1 regulatory subunit 7